MDLNGDGRRDILSGSYSWMKQPMAGVFQVLWGQEDGGFKKAETLTGADDKPLIIPTEGEEQLTETICTRPTAIDWDGDGDLDLIVGNFSGTFYLFNGNGKGEFEPKPQPIMSGKSALRIDGAHSDPFVVDWDADGDLDLLSGSSNGGVQWAENSAGKGEPPELKPFQTLIPTGSSTPYGQFLREGDLTGPTSSTRIWVDDVNGDGKLDILVGDSVTLISPADGVNKEEFQEKQAKWQKEFEAAAADLQAAGEDAKKREKATQRYLKVYQQKSKFMNEERTGFVWLYVRK